MPEVIKTILTGDSAQLRAEFSKSTAALRDYQASQQTGFSRAIAGHENEIKALKLEADGFKNLANSLRQSTALREQATRLAATGNITEKAALAILQEKLLLQQRISAAAQQEASARQAGAARTAAIANPRATGLPGGGTLAPLTPQSLQSIDRAIASQRELRRQTLLAGQSGKSGALGFLAFSQAVEDAQYGIKGVLNNIPQMILGFGGTAGLAGALSLAAVAAVILYPHLQKLFGTDAVDRLEKAAKAMDEVWKKGKLAAAAIREDATAAERLSELAAQTNEYYRERLQLGSVLATQNDEQLALDRAARTRAKELFEAKLALSALQGRNQDPLRDISARGDIGGLQTDLVNRNNELARSAAEVARVAETSGNIIAEDAARRKVDTEALVRLTERLTVAQTKLAGTTSQKEDLKGKGQNYGRLGIDEVIETANVKAIEKEIEAFQARRKVIEDSTAAALAEAKTTIASANDKARATYQEVEALKAEIKQRKELLEIAQQTAQITRAAAAWKALQDAIKTARDESRKGLENDPITNNTEANEAEKKRFTDARAQFAAEFLAQRLEQQGRKEVANKLREEFKLREDALALAKELNITEARALTLLREKAALNDPKKASPLRDPGAIRNTGRGLRSVELGSNFTGSLRNSELRRRGTERAILGRPTTDPTLKHLERSVNLQEELLGVFKKLGVY